MGRPGKSVKASRGPTRRGFFRRTAGAATALAAAPVLPLAAAAAAEVRFEHGVASGDPLADRVILWTRVTPSAPREKLAVRLQISRDPSMTPLLREVSVTTGAERDYTVKIDAGGLDPDTTYYYRFRCKQAVSPIGRTKTLPAGAVERVRLAVVSCSNHAAGYFNAYRRIAERADLDAVVHLGDAIYEYGSGEYGDLRACEPPHEILTLADYRTRHAQYKRDADSQEMLRQHPLIAIWDDHETANNAWAGGAENHTPETEGPWAARVEAALRAYYEWMPVRLVDPADLRRNNRRFAFGDLVDLLMLEERLQARSEQLPATIPSELGIPLFVQQGAFTDPSRGLLGEAQESWLGTRLRASKARWKLIGQGVMMAQLKAVGAPLALGGGAFLNPDQWDGYQPARDRLYDLIDGRSGGRPVDNVVVLTGDIHSSWAADLTRDPNNPLPGSGGYDPATGEGSLAVEFVCTSVSSPGADDPDGAFAALLRSQNPHFKYVELTRRGYMLIDIDPSRVVCEWWHLATVAAPDPGQSLAAAFAVDDGRARLRPAAATAAKPLRRPAP